MKRFLIAIALLCLTSVFSTAQPSDEEAIKQVVASAYIDGIQNNGKVEAIRSGFHPTFTMLRLVENEVKPYPIEEWIAAIEKRKAEAKPTSTRTEGKFISIDITGNAATVKLELYREARKTFTDYLVLYKFAEGWKIVSKTYYKHP